VTWQCAVQPVVVQLTKDRLILIMPDMVFGMMTSLN
jgi:hypothetical protein